MLGFNLPQNNHNDQDITLNTFETLIAQAPNGYQIEVSLIPLKKLQNTLQGFKSVEVGKKVRLASGRTVQLNMDGRSFYTDTNQLFRFV